MNIRNLRQFNIPIFYNIIRFAQSHAYHQFYGHFLQTELQWHPALFFFITPRTHRFILIKFFFPWMLAVLIPWFRNTRKMDNGRMSLSFQYLFIKFPGDKRIMQIKPILIQYIISDRSYQLRILKQIVQYILIMTSQPFRIRFHIIKEFEKHLLFTPIFQIDN